MVDNRDLNLIRVAKYAVKAVSIALSVFIILVIGGPIVGAVSPLLGTQQPPVGIGVDLQSVQSQLQFFNSSSTLTGTHDIVVPAFNNWPIPGGANLSLSILVNGSVIYQSQPASVRLGPFQSEELHVSMVVSPSLVSKLQGQQVGIGGTMSLSEGQYWTITVSFPQ
jgi:hypothetical protein